MIVPNPIAKKMKSFLSNGKFQITACFLDLTLGLVDCAGLDVVTVVVLTTFFFAIFLSYYILFNFQF
jgi:hypothetical protein